MKYEIARMLAQGAGAIVNLSSANGLVGLAGLGAYTAAKHGIIGLTRSAAKVSATSSPANIAAISVDIEVSNLSCANDRRPVSARPR